MTKKEPNRERLLRSLRFFFEYFELCLNFRHIHFCDHQVIYTVRLIANMGWADFFSTWIPRGRSCGMMFFKKHIQFVMRLKKTFRIDPFKVLQGLSHTFRDRINGILRVHAPG